MREIKFRGKRVDKEEFAFGDLLTGMGYKKGKFFILPHLSYYPSDCHSVDGYEVKPETIGQYTGLKDKNGKDIYEGDIMNDPTSMCVGVVEWNSILCQFQLSWQNMHTAADLFFMVKCGSIVIGNIHDNPELLTK